jgi:3D (Asp-Asp-Asp) domain-containing protein
MPAFLRRPVVLASAALAVVLAIAGGTWMALRERTALLPAGDLLREQARAIARLLPPARPVTGPELGSFQLTYYWLASETRPDGEQIELQTKQCKTIARVSEAFAKNIRMEGSGVLGDGRVITLAGGCECGAPCYRLADRSHRFGTGASARPLSPFRSVAVDPRLVRLGSMLYIPELDGMVMPGPAPWGGFVHDGCVMADDRGGGIKGRQLDLFTVKRAHYTSLSRRLGLRRVSVMAGADRCSAAPPRHVAAARRGGV